MCDRCRLRSVPRPELVEDVRRVDADGLAADEQGVPDLLVGPTGGDEAEDLRLSIREAEPAGSGRSWGTKIGPIARIEIDPRVAGERPDLLDQGPRPEPDRDYQGSRQVSVRVLAPASI